MHNVCLLNLYYFKFNKIFNIYRCITYYNVPLETIRFLIQPFFLLCCVNRGRENFTYEHISEIVKEQDNSGLKATKNEKISSNRSDIACVDWIGSTSILKLHEAVGILIGLGTQVCINFKRRGHISCHIYSCSHNLRVTVPI